ncbi:zinc finger protein 583-like [Artemia franciscana]|uniref:zinc finger protein 583-like n=1 Tax=Artemia franciscana TaxID=6661 RepID=UPI0032DB76C3
MTEEINPLEFVAIKLEVEAEDKVSGITDFNSQPNHNDTLKTRFYISEPVESPKPGFYEMASMALNDPGITNASSPLTGPSKQTSNILCMESFSNIHSKQCTESYYNYKAAVNTTVFDEFNVSSQEDPKPKTRVVESVTTKIFPCKKQLYKCPVCSKYYPNGRLSIHMRVHTKKKLIHTKKIFYECDTCNKTFTQKASLDVHQRIHRGEKPYMCDMCKKRFRTSSALSVHQRTHTGVKPFECDICKHRFTTKTYFTAHQRIHTGEKPYMCDICKLRYRTAGQLSHHKRKLCHRKTF